MNEIYSQFCDFFGLDVMPADLGELLPWLFSVVLAFCIVCYVLGFISQMVRSINR